MALITFIGIWFFGESMTFTKIGFIAMIVVGVVGLQITADDSTATQKVTLK